MRNTPLKAFAKKSPIKQNESISDSTYRGNVREVTIEPPEKRKPGVVQQNPGTIYSKSDQQLKALQQTNPLATLFLGRS